MRALGRRGCQALRRSWVFFVGLAALLPLVAFAGYALFSALQAYRDVDEARLRGTARALAAAVDAQLGIYIATLATLASSELLNSPDDIEAFERRARDAVTNLGAWTVLVGPPPDFPILANTLVATPTPARSGIPSVGQDAIMPAYRTVFERGETAVTDTFIGVFTGRPVIAIMMPVSRPGQPPRALGLSVEPTAFQALLARQALPEGTFAAIADSRLRIVAHSLDPEGRRIGAQAPEWIQPAILGRESALVAGHGWSGDTNIYAVETLERAPGWTVTVAEPLASQRASAWAGLGLLIAGASALWIGVAVVVWASQSEAVRLARREMAALEEGRQQIERLHAGLPAVIFLSVVRIENDRLRVTRLYRGGDSASVMGWPLEAFRRMDTMEAISDYGAVPMAAHFRTLIERGEHKWEWRLRRQDGSWNWIRTRARRLAIAPDGSAEVIGYDLNIERERQAEARSMAAARLASLGEMAAGLAHEIKQPLQSILLSAEVAQASLRDGSVADVDRRLSRIATQTLRTSALIDHLRRFARGAEAGSLAEVVSVAEAVDGALDLMRSGLRDASIGLEIDLGEPPPLVRGQTVLLEQVLSNLLLNARDALVQRPQGAPRRIRISAADGPQGMVTVTVADNGGGLPPDVMSRVFEPFVTTKSPDKGTGLGLSICYGLVHEMGGTIDVRNDGDGAVFTIALPSAGARSGVSGGESGDCSHEALASAPQRRS